MLYPHDTPPFSGRLRLRGSLVHVEESVQACRDEGQLHG